MGIVLSRIWIFTKALSYLAARLGFSVAVHLDPDILLIDEVLAVGDAEFQKKCLGKIGEVTHGGRTAIFISHNLGSVAALCPVALLMNAGSVQAHTVVSDVLTEYEQLRDVPSTSSVDLRELPHFGDGPEGRSAELLELRFVSGSAVQPEGEPVMLELDVRNTFTQRLSFGVGLVAPDETPVAVGFSDETDVPVSDRHVVRVTLPVVDLVPGDYRISVSVGHGNSRTGSVHDIDGVGHAATLRITAASDGTQRWSRVWGWHRVRDVAAEGLALHVGVGR